MVGCQYILEHQVKVPLHHHRYARIRLLVGSLLPYDETVVEKVGQVVRTRITGNHQPQPKKSESELRSFAVLPKKNNKIIMPFVIPCRIFAIGNDFEMRPL